MQLPRMTTRRWIVVVATSAIFVVGLMLKRRSDISGREPSFTQSARRIVLTVPMTLRRFQKSSRKSLMNSSISYSVWERIPIVADRPRLRHMLNGRVSKQNRMGS